MSNDLGLTPKANKKYKAANISGVDQVSKDNQYL